jgi:predicted nucleic acid-binding protein
MIRSPTSVICDAGPIIHLDEINCLNLLNDFKEIILPFSVEREIAAHRPSALTASSLNLKRLAESLDIGEKLHALSQIFSLDAGEIESLILMQSHPTAIFLTDDAAARLVAEQMKLKVHADIVKKLKKRSFFWTIYKGESPTSILSHFLVGVCAPREVNFRQSSS